VAHVGLADTEQLGGLDLLPSALFPERAGKKLLWRFRKGQLSAPQGGGAAEEGQYATRLAKRVLRRTCQMAIEK